MHFPSSRDSGDKRWREPLGDSLDLAKGYSKSLGHVLARHILGREHKLTHRIPFESTLFEEAVTNSLVGGEQDLAVLSYEGKPVLVRRTTRKVTEMALEASVEVEDNFVRVQLLLRRAAIFGGEVGD
jgi:hypothetical protein